MEIKDVFDGSVKSDLTVVVTKVWFCNQAIECNAIPGVTLFLEGVEESWLHIDTEMNREYLIALSAISAIEYEYMEEQT